MHDFFNAGYVEVNHLIIANLYKLTSSGLHQDEPFPLHRFMKGPHYTFYLSSLYTSSFDFS